VIDGEIILTRYRYNGNIRNCFPAHLCPLPLTIFLGKGFLSEKLEMLIEEPETKAALQVFSCSILRFADSIYLRVIE
jgi:hypothetical protein